MEMTPLNLRDNPVSLGDGAKPHGRDLSSTESTASKEAAQEAQSQPKTEIEKQQKPIDTTAEALAARLRMADPKLDAKAANKLAKELLADPNDRWETKDSGQDHHGSVNLKA